MFVNSFFLSLGERVSFTLSASPNWGATFGCVLKEMDPTMAVGFLFCHWKVLLGHHPSGGRF